MENKKEPGPKSFQELFGLTDEQLEYLKKGKEDRQTLRNEEVIVASRMMLQRIIPRYSKYDLLNPEEYNRHLALIKNIGDTILSREGRRFVIDGNNAEVIRFMLLYFNDHKECEDVFPDYHHVLEKNLLIVGEAGTGKTMLMEIFSKYLYLTKNRLYYHNTSMVRLMNYYKVHSHINKFTFNESKEAAKCEPLALCLNDIGLEVESQKSYGTDIRDVVDEFLYARYEIYQQWYIRTHLTSNYDVEDFKKRFNYRINDRFKSYNLVPLTGASRRG